MLNCLSLSSTHQYAWSSSSSSIAVLLFVVLLVVVFGLISVLGPNTANWVIISPSASPSLNLTATSPSSSDSNDDVLGLRLTVAVLDMNSTEEAHSDDSVQNRSSSPPIAIEDEAEALPTLQQPL
ncbi:hypothetical protein ACFX15_022547 [Malus domestica]